MAYTSNINKGMYIDFNGEPHVIIEKVFYSPGKGAAFNRTKLKSLRSGKIVSQVFKSGEKVDEIVVDTKTMQFIYIDGDKAVFMDPQTYDQVSVPLNTIDGEESYLHTEAKYVMISYDGEVLSVQLPKKIVLEVAKTSGATKGNTATNATKEAEMETGVKIQVPLFVKEGDKIEINTESESYVAKAE